MRSAAATRQGEVKLRPQPRILMTLISSSTHIIRAKAPAHICRARDGTDCGKYCTAETNYSHGNQTPAQSARHDRQSEDRHALSLSGNLIIASTIATTLGPCPHTNNTDSLSASRSKRLRPRPRRVRSIAMSRLAPLTDTPGDANSGAEQELQRPRVLHYSSPPLFFFFLLLEGACPASFRRCTTKRVHDSSLSHSKPARYWRSSSSSACARRVRNALGV